MPSKLSGMKAATNTTAALFSDASAIRRVHRESMVLLGGGRALLMQVAHPAVAAGVAEHSAFRGRRLERLLRTLRPTLAIVFGSPAQVRAAAASINAVHEQVVGDGYRATDPDLLLWVLATLIDTALLMHQRFLRPLSEEEADAYYRDMLRAGALLGVSRDEAPEDIAAFRRYVEDTLRSLKVSGAGRRIAAELFAAGPPAAPVFAALRELTAGLLPAVLREQFGLGWGPGRERALEVLAATSRLVVPRLPSALRAPPRLVMPARQGRPG